MRMDGVRAGVPKFGSWRCYTGSRCHRRNIKKNDTLHVCICKYTSFCNRTVEYNTSLFNPLKTKSRLRPTSYRAVNTFHLGYKNQSVYAVSGTSRCLFSDKYETHKYSVGRAYSCWMLNCWCITWPVGFKRLIKVHCNSKTIIQIQNPPKTRTRNNRHLDLMDGLWKYCKI